MKVKKSILFFLISLFFIHLSIADEVSLNKASLVAKNVYWERSGHFYKNSFNQISISDVLITSEQGMNLYYAFTMNAGEGFVVVAAEDHAYPVLGYSSEGAFDENNIPPALQFLLDSYKTQLLAIRHNGLQSTPGIDFAWQRYSQTNFQPDYGFLAVSPLLSTTWDQGCYYNQQCPSMSSGPCGHVWAGCVAVSMAQVMKYWSHPAQGTGNHSYSHTVANGYANNFGTLSANFGNTTYNWNSMPNSVTSNNTAVATLMYHCGVAVEMNYDTSGSGSYTGDARNSLVNYFGYSSGAQYLSKSSYSNMAWDNLIRAELDSARPVIYRGDGSSGGHAWVLDGYQGANNNHFHMNWGWSGYNNGYFYLNNLNPGSYTFTLNQKAIMGIVPQSQGPTADFVGNPLVFPVGGKVNFYDLSTGTPGTYAWSFPGGTPSSSTQQDPSNILYNTAGNYNVSLTAANTGGSDVETKSNYIQVTSVPGSGCTLVNYPVAGTPTYYATSAGGYVAGNNGYGDKAKAEFFSNSSSLQLSGVYIWFAIGDKNSSGSSNVTVKVWQNNGASGAPGTVLGSATISMDTIVSDVNNQKISYIPFTQSISINGSYFLGVDLPANGDTIAMYTNTDGDVSTNTAWEQWSNNTWYEYSSSSAWGLTLSHAIYPVICSSVPTVTTDFSANQTTVVAGDTVTFSDLSTGNPTSWVWNFQGGIPGNYSGQNPPGIKYNNSGTYNVRLIASNAQASDTMDKLAYITVLPAGSSICDTLSNLLSTDTLTNYYFTSNWGYFPGHNGYTMDEYADLFTNSSSTNVDAIRIYPVYAYGGSAQSYITLKVWSVSGNSPGTVLGSQQVPISNLTAGQWNTINLTNPVAVTGNFFVGFELNYTTTPMDTFACYTAQDRGTQGTNTGYVTYNNSWMDFNSLLGMHSSMAIEPIVCTGSTPSGPTADFSGTPLNIIEGASVTFTNASTGNPTSWNWQFSGGTPSSYIGQTPPNIAYSNAGNYDVTLIVSNANGSDTLTKSNYVQVSPASTSTCDTLHYPLSGTKNLYTSSGWGYVSGNNYYDDMAKADYFSGFAPYTALHGAYFDFAVAATGSSSNTLITVGVWDNSGTGGSPGSVMASTTIPLSTIVTNVNSQSLTYVQFSNTVMISNPFYLGVILPTAASDTIALYTNTDDDVVPGTGWEMWSDSSWYNYNDASSWGMDLVHAIYPYVCQTSVNVTESKEPEVLIYPNPTNDKVYLLFAEGVCHTPHIQLFDNLGSQIAFADIQQMDSRKFELNLQHVQNGVYFLVIQYKGNKILRKLSVMN